MSGLNGIVEGRVIGTPEKRVSKRSGKNYTTFSLGYNEYNGEERIVAVRCFTERTSSAAARLTPGCAVQAEGALFLNSFEKNGEKVASLSINATIVRLIDPPEGTTF
jgi:single-stranded DNA-binding protein